MLTFRALTLIGRLLIKPGQKNVVKGLCRDGKSVENSTKNAYFATFCNARQNSVNSPELNQVVLKQRNSTLLLAQC